MNTYRLHIVATVAAESESAARQCFIDDDFDDVSLVGVEPAYICWVCREPIVGEDPHTYHEEGCPKRDESPCLMNECAQLSGCGEDVHVDHCPTCTGQAF